MDLCDSCKNNVNDEKCLKKIDSYEWRDGKMTTCMCYVHADGREQNYEISKNELTKTMRHMQVCKELNSLYHDKNNDYGDSFAKVRNELGNVAILVRLYDKIGRLKTLLTGTKQKVNDESIEDSLRDLANYCILELVERAVDKDGNK